MVRLRNKVWALAVVVSAGCTGARQQIAEPVEEPATYVDPWGTPVAWSQVPVGTSVGATAPAAAETEEPKPKVEEEAPPPTPEPEPPAAPGNLGGDEDDDE